MLKKLSASLLTAQDAKLLGFTALTAAQVAAQHPALPAHRAGFVIPYYDLNGRPTKFYRFRYLEYGHDTGFAALVAGQLKQLRYGQEAGTVNELYLPPFAKWAEYAVQADKPIVITEGELKAACATKAGLPTIGLGGVWCFKAGTVGLHLLPQFKLFNWKQRMVYIVYDSDAASNHQVIKAENALARELCTLGAIPMVVRLPVPRTPLQPVVTGGDKLAFTFQTTLSGNRLSSRIAASSSLPAAVRCQLFGLKGGRSG